MKAIIAAVNFTPASLNALDYAANMAAEINARLFIIHIIEVPVAGLEAPVTDIGIDDLLHEAQNKLELLRQELLKRIAAEIDIHAEVRIGFLQPELLNICENFKPFALVIGTEQRSMIEILFIGNGAIPAIRVLNCPVLIIPPHIRFKKIKRIGFACDLKDIYDLPVQFLEDLVQSFNASLDIIHVSRNKKEESQNYVSASIVKNQLKKLNPVVHFVINKDVEKGITAFAKKNQKDLILVIHKKRDFLESLFHKSQSQRLELDPQLPIAAITANEQKN